MKQWSERQPPLFDKDSPAIRDLGPVTCLGKVPHLAIALLMWYDQAMTKTGAE